MELVEVKELGLITCGEVEDVVGALTPVGRGVAQVVCHALRVQELSEQLEVEEEDGDRQEEEVEEKREVESRRVRHVDDHGWSYESAQDLSHEVCVYHHEHTVERCACRLSACTPRVR